MIKIHHQGLIYIVEGTKKSVNIRRFYQSNIYNNFEENEEYISKFFDDNKKLLLDIIQIGKEYNLYI